MTELANCTECNAVFVKVTRDICPKCYAKEEADFQKVYKFLTIRKNRKATIPEIVDATDVEEELIFKFIKQKRLRTSDFPSLTYPCESCDEPITEGRLCHACTIGILEGLEEHEQSVERERRRSEEESKGSVYFAINKDSKK